MARGRKSKPTSLKLLDGNPGKTKVNDNEPEFSPSDGQIPEYLDERAREIWDKTFIQLQNNGMAADVDEEMLGSYCQMCSRLEALERRLAEEGMIIYQERYNKNGNITSREPRNNPILTEIRQTAGHIRSFASEFGFSPASRARLNVSEAPKDDFSEFMSKRDAV